MKIVKRKISDIINSDFKRYALYTLQSRGIPAFDDSLTPVQRIILKNAKVNYEKTLSLIGACIADGYSHGDGSLAGAVSKITREFNAFDNLMEGKGFWGSPVVHDAAAPRYTSIRINNKIRDKYFVYSHLDEKIDDVWQPLHFNLPIGLSSITMGIGVGYKTLILPRKIDDLQRYYDGDLKEVKPYFKNFTGKIRKHKQGWIISGNYTVTDNKIHISDIPHLLKYSSFLTKLTKQIEDEEIDCKIQNNSAKIVDLTIIFKKEDKRKLLEIVEKNIKVIVQESIVFVHENSVLTYNKLEDYLDDYKIRIAEIEAKQIEYEYQTESFNLAFERAKLEYLQFMSEKERTRAAVLKFLDKYEQRIAAKLDAIKLSKLSKDTIKETIAEIKRLEGLTAKLKVEAKKVATKYNKLKKKFKFTGSISDTTQQDFEEIDGISVFDVEQLEEEIYE